MGRNNGFKECPLEKGATKRGWPVGVMPWGMTTAEVGKGACISFSWPFFQFGIDTLNDKRGLGKSPSQMKQNSMLVIAIIHFMVSDGSDSPSFSY